MGLFSLLKDETNLGKWAVLVYWALPNESTAEHANTFPNCNAWKGRAPDHRRIDLKYDPVTKPDPESDCNL